MPNAEIDLDADGLNADENESVQPASTVKSEKPIDYKAKWQGVQSLYDKVVAKAKREEENRVAAYAQYEQDLANLRAAAAEQAKKAETYQILEAEKAKLEKEVTKHKSRFEVFSKIQQQYSGLSDLFLAGDLKDQDDFESPEAYDEYLTRMNSRTTPIASVTQSNVNNRTQGAVPSVQSTARSIATTRALQEITDEMYTVSPVTEAGRIRFEALLKEQDAAMARDSKKRA